MVKKSLKDIFEQIQVLKQKSTEKGGEIWFRGQRCAKWPLRSSFHRHILKVFEAIEKYQTLTEQEKKSLLWEEYKSQTYQFQNLAWSLLEHKEQNDWGVIFSMQHHQIPTLLMDWTDNLICALYFASCKKCASDDAALYVLSPHDLNEITIGQSGLIGVIPRDREDNGDLFNVNHYLPTRLSDRITLPPFAISPPLTNPRIQAQGGKFIMCGNSFEPLEEKYPNCIKKIILSTNILDEIQSFLKLIGIRHFHYFPDINGLSKDFQLKQELNLQEIKKKIQKDKD